MMQQIFAYELQTHSGAAFDDRRFLDAGIVAVKRRETSEFVSRSTSRPLRTH
jgi:hypothetical protein